MPASAWYMLWQWTIQSPALSASSTIAKDCIGAMRTVSLRRENGVLAQARRQGEGVPVQVQGVGHHRHIDRVEPQALPGPDRQGFVAAVWGAIDHPPIGLH